MKGPATHEDLSANEVHSGFFSLLGLAGADKVVDDLLKDEHSSRVRAAVAKALGEIGPAAETAVPALKAALKDRNFKVRFEALIALRAIRKANRVSV